MSKTMGGGVPISATVFKEDIGVSELEEDSYHIYTNQGIPLSCVAVSAVVDIVVEEDMPGKAEKMRKFWYQRLKKLEEKTSYHWRQQDKRTSYWYWAGGGQKKTKKKVSQEALRVLEERQKQGVSLPYLIKQDQVTLSRLNLMVITEEL